MIALQDEVQFTGRILVVDDDETFSAAICVSLNKAGHQADFATSGKQAVMKLSQELYEIVLLDLYISKGTSGLDILAFSEKLAPETAFIVLTAHPSLDTAIEALRLGVDDYLQKPASLLEILQAVNKTLRKVRLSSAGNVGRDGRFPPKPIESETSDSRLQAAGIVVDVEKKEVVYRERPLSLTPTEYKLLFQFIRQPNVLFSYRMLAYRVYDTDLDEKAARKLLRTHLYRLRCKLDAAETTKKGPLKIVRGQGYILRTLPADDTA